MSWPETVTYSVAAICGAAVLITVFWLAARTGR